MPAQRTMRRVLAENILGELGYATLIQHKVRPKPYNPSPHEQLWQMCVHNFDSVLAILQRKPISICAHSFVPPWSRYRPFGIAGHWHEVFPGHTDQDS